MRRSTSMYMLAQAALAMVAGCATPMSANAPVTKAPPLAATEPVPTMSGPIEGTAPYADSRRTLADRIENPVTPSNRDDIGEHPMEVIADRPVVVAPEIIALTDDKIVRVAQVANQGEIEAAQLAETRAENPAVRRYAKLMLTDHALAQQKARRVAKRFALDPKTSPAAEAIASDGAKKLEYLRDKTGAAFDVAYLDAQVAEHEQVLRVIDDQLTRDATLPAVKALVKNMRPAVEQHLVDAQALQAKLNK